MNVVNSFIDLNQFAYCQGHNSNQMSTCLVKVFRYSNDADLIRVFSFDSSKAFDSASQSILCAKLTQVNINPHVINWLISSLRDRKQRVVVDGIHTSYLSINIGVTQGTVLGPILFSILINDVKTVNP